MAFSRRVSVAVAAALAASCGTTTIGRSQVAISADPLAVNFGSQPAGSRTSKQVTIRNDGLAILVISSAAISGDTRGAFSVGAAPAQLSPATSAVLQVTYAAPDATGADGASLTITSNADNAPQLSISLSAQSVAGCTAESDAAFCTRVGKNCGAVTAADNCGTSRTASCGSCSGAQSCGGNGVANVCGTPPSYPVTVTLAGAGTGSVTSSPAGISCGATCSSSFTSGTSVTLTATPGANSTFAGFTGDCTGLTCTLGVGAAKNVTASFAPIQHTLSVTIAGSGTVTSSPAGINCSSGTCTGTFNDGQAIVLTASPAANFSFSGWTGGGCSAGNCNITLSGANASTTATFAPIQHLLNVTIAGSGSVVSNPAGINCNTGTCSGTFNDGQAITLTATPASNSAFSGWSGGNCSGAGTCTITLSGANASTTATFAANQHTLSVTISGSGSVTSNPAGINCSSGTCTGTFNDGAAITLTATPAANNTFSGWTGGGCSGAGTCSITLSGASASTTASFGASHLITPRAEHSAVLLPSGKVLAVGGVGTGGVPLKDAELYDPATGTWTSAGSVTHSLWHSTATLLNDGRVLIVGGFNGDYNTGIYADTWLYTEAGGFVAGPAFPSTRAFHSAVLLQSGKVLIVTGLSNGTLCSYPTDTQLFDPTANSGAGAWTATGSIHADRSSAPVALLSSGKVLLTGGPQDNCPSNNTGQSEAELYDPSTGQWTVTGSMITTRGSLDLLALPNGDALAAAGSNNTGALLSAETFHLASAGAFSSTGPLTNARQNDAAVSLPGGRVAAVGGANGTTYLTSVEIYDPVAGTWSAGKTPLTTGRSSHTATLLNSGKLLAAGGYGAGSSGQIVLGSFELLDEPQPAWVYKADMPSSRGGEAVGAANGLLLVAEGFPSTTLNEGYDPSTNSWSTKASGSVSGRSYGPAAGIGTKLYVTGGCAGSDCRVGITNQLEVYDAVANSWTTKAPMPTGRFQAGSAALDGKLYVVGGTTACPPCTQVATLEVYDPTTDTWATKQPLSAARSGMAAAGLNHLLYIFGGTTSAVVGTVQVYDPATDTWTTKTSMPTPRSGAAAAVVGGLIYVISGNNASGTSVATVEAYNPLTDSWTTQPPVLTPRYEAAAATIGNVIYLVGAAASNTPTNKLEAYAP